MARKAIARHQLRPRAGRFFGIDEQELKHIYDNLERILDKTSAEEMKADFLRAGMVLRDRARVNVPVRTGLLRSAIFADAGTPSKPDVLVGVNHRMAPHGHMVEYGTSRSKPHPFFRPAITASRDAMARMIIEAFQKAIKTATRR